MRTLYSLTLMLMASLAFAQGDQPFFYREGKIYVVVAVLLIIFAGIAYYLFRLDRKVRKLEKRNEA